VTAKPDIDRSDILRFGLALVAKGLFDPIYQTAEGVWGKDKTAELFAWVLSAKQKQEEVEANPPPLGNDEPINIPPVVADDLDISNVVEASSGNIITEQRIPITHELKSARIQGGNEVIQNDLPSSYWSDRSNHMKFCRCYCYWRGTDGRVYGGHFDWLRPGQSFKTISNVTVSYFRIKPQAGARLYFSFVANNQSGRTQVRGS
jgi:hypothetical protein